MVDGREAVELQVAGDVLIEAWWRWRTLALRVGPGLPSRVLNDDERELLGLGARLVGAVREYENRRIASAYMQKRLEGMVRRSGLVM